MKTLAITLILILSQTVIAHNEFEPLDYQIKPQNYKYEPVLPLRSKAIDDYLENNPIKEPPDIEDYIDRSELFRPSPYEGMNRDHANDILKRCAYTTAFGCGLS